MAALESSKDKILFVYSDTGGKKSRPIFNLEQRDEKFEFVTVRLSIIGSVMILCSSGFPGSGQQRLNSDFIG